MSPLEMLKERLKKKTKIKGDCWIYDVECRYPQILFAGKQRQINRIVCHLVYNLDLDDLEFKALHKDECTDTRCYQPEHLYVGTQRENIQDWMEKRASSPSTHCVHGHSMADAYVYRGYRWCRECRYLRKAEQRARQKANQNG